jgi:hypothetical protein
MQNSSVGAVSETVLDVTGRAGVRAAVAAAMELLRFQREQLGKKLVRKRNAPLVDPPQAHSSRLALLRLFVPNVKRTSAADFLSLVRSRPVSGL